MRPHPPARHGVSTLLALGLLAPVAGRCEALTHYSVQSLAKLGHPAGDLVPTDAFVVGQLNDSGQVAFLTSLAGRAALVQYSGATFTTVAVAKGPAPAGKTWPSSTGLFPPSMNEAGNIAFVPVVPGSSGPQPLGVYLWDNKTQTVTPVATPGMPAANGKVFVAGGDHGGATINNKDEIAFVGFVKNGKNQTRGGIFLRPVDGQIQGVALPDDSLPGGEEQVVDAGDPYINDAGAVAFVAFGTPGPPNKSYVWENGAINVICERGTEIPDFGTANGAVNLGWVADNDGVLFATRLTTGGPQALFLWGQGKLLPVVAYGQEMPDGGTYEDQQISDWGSGHERGPYPIEVRINDNGVPRSAVYLVDGGGNLTPVLKSGMTTNLGTITGIGGQHSYGLSVNGKGQVALTAQIDKGPDTLLLLTPVSP